MRVGYLELAACADVIMLNNSDAGARDYAAWLAIAPKRYRVVRNGVDLSTLAQSTEDLRTRLSVPADAPLIGSIFRFYEEKQPLFWVETAALVASAHADAHFVVFGIGPLLKEAQAVAAKHGFAERFHTPGALPGAAHMLSALDVFLLTSQFEGTPNVVLEASAAGVPVVTTKAGGTAEAVEEGVTGYVVDEPDAAKLAARVLAVLGDDAFRARCKAAGPDFVTRRFGLQRMIDETLALYGLG
jgi:glycosyltransferase involved in cell wall biosynthesis